MILPTKYKIEMPLQSESVCFSFGLLHYKYKELFINLFCSKTF